MTEILSELADRVEGASGPDRELDEHIKRTVEGWHAKARFDNPPTYTASLDAAMSLVPEGVWFHLSDYRKGLGETGAEAHLYGRSADWKAEAATPALALTAAALRARGSEQP